MMYKLELDPIITGSILDIGGGGEGVIGRLYGESVTAIDNRQEELDEAPDVCTKLLMDATKLEFPDASFDNVTFFYSLMYIEADTQIAALREAARVLKSGGTVHIWDADIESARPEPFVTELEIRLPREVIRTAYGIVKDGTQCAESIESLCAIAGLKRERKEEFRGNFYLRLLKRI